MSTGPRRGALVASIVLVLGIAAFVWIGRPVRAALQRGTIEGLEAEPFFPDPDPLADAILGAARLATVEIGAERGPPDQQLLAFKFPELRSLDEGPWYLTLYVPTTGEERGPHVVRLTSNQIGLAVQALRERLPPQHATAEAMAAWRFKVDQVLPGRRDLPPKGGLRGVAVDPGLDGIELTHESHDQPFHYLPSWSIEREPKRRRIVRDAQKAAEELAGWSQSEARDATVRAFRSRAWVEALGGGAPARGIQRGNAPGKETTKENVIEAARLAGDFLRRETAANGRITYVYETMDDTRSNKNYNMLRHAGTAYSMFQVVRLTGDEALFAAGERAMGYFRARMKEDEAHPGEWYILDGGRRKRAKLGGAGLGLLAYVEMEKTRPGSTDYEAMFGLARHIVRMQHEDGEFESFYDWNGQENSTRKSTFYPGEAVLGLTRLHQLTGDQRWLDAAVKGADWLVHERWVALGLRIYVPMDAWLTQALVELDRVAPDDDRRDYAFALADSIARHKLMDPDKAPPDLLGSDLSGLGSLPLAANAGSFGEALSAAARMEQRRLPGSDRYRTFAMRNLGMQLRHQFTEANDWFLPNPEAARGGFRERPNVHQIRNDYVQHNISGLMGMLPLFDAAMPDLGLQVDPAERHPDLVRAMEATR